MLDAVSGLRWGELMGLRVCDFELDFRDLHVNRTVVEVAKRLTNNGSRSPPARQS